MENNSPFVMNIGDKKRFDRNGKRVKNFGYSKRIAEHLVEFLKEHEAVELVMLGAAPVNNAVKAICRAQEILESEGKSLVADKFALKDVDLSSQNGETRPGKATTIRVVLINE